MGTRGFWTVALRIELLRSPVVWLVPVLLGVGIGVTWHALPRGIAYWPSTLAAANASVALTGPVLGAFAAFTGSREHRLGLGPARRLSIRGGWLFGAAELGALAVWSLVAQAGVVLTVVIRTALSSPTGEFSLLVVTAGAAGLLCNVALGHLAGRLLPYRLLPPLVAIALYTINLLGSGRYGKQDYLLFPVLIDEPGVFDAWQPGLYERQSLWLLGAATLIALASLALAGPTRTLYVAGAAALAVTVTGAVATTALEGRYFARSTPAFTYSCETRSITVCVHPAFAGALPGLTRTFTPVARQLAGTPASFDRLEQRPRGVGGAPSPGSRAIRMDDLAPGRMAATRQEFFEELLDVDRCAAADPEAVARTDEAAALLERTPEALPPRWAADRFEAFTTCALRKSDLPR
ncbi:hypothetical protein [Streptomyces sp. NBC_01429]|uniref:hypothetical protein n=1 Tax=Streptomyces sp. NBC_01429 TaxID=2903862 RepID=UPI002E2922EC|nr:hypothetical protein [Streptomyces sp. NBC_01429]